MRMAEANTAMLLGAEHVSSAGGWSSSSSPHVETTFLPLTLDCPSLALLELSTAGGVAVCERRAHALAAASACPLLLVPPCASIGFSTVVAICPARALDAAGSNGDGPDIASEKNSDSSSEDGGGGGDEPWRPSGRGVLLILIDGTWTQARHMPPTPSIAFHCLLTPSHCSILIEGTWMQARHMHRWSPLLAEACTQVLGRSLIPRAHAIADRHPLVSPLIFSAHAV